jgi:hypothetical protein
MRIAVIAFCLVGLAYPALAESPCVAKPGFIPPPKAAQRTPTAPYKIIKLDSFSLQIICKAPETNPFVGCAIPPPSANSNDKWIIALDEKLTGRSLACVMLYEKAHLPPNLWADPHMETPEAMVGSTFY